jgi:hypothetical protein
MSRQVRVRVQYASWYPSIPPRVWQRAETVRHLVFRQLRHGSPSWQPGPRVLSDVHFEFRGSSAREPERLAGVERRRASRLPSRERHQPLQP